MPLTFCRECGGYTTTRKGKLLQPCRPKMSTILTRLRQGKHPSTRVPLCNVRPVEKISQTIVLLTQANKSLVEPVLPDQLDHPPDLDCPWDDQDLAAAAEPGDHEADDLEDQWAVAFEAAAAMGIEMAM